MQSKDIDMMNDFRSEVTFEYTGDNHQNVPKNVAHVRFHSSVTVVGNSYNFQGYTFKSLKGVVFNEGLQDIGPFSFNGCRLLEYINIPSTVTEIGDSAFLGCDKLRNIVFNDGLNKIGVYAFRYCSSLQSITLPSTLTQIDSYAFGECTRLIDVAVPEGIQKISSNAFNGCLALQRLTFPNLSLRLEAIVNTSRTEIRNKINTIRGPSWRGRVEWRDGEMYIPRSALAGNNWEEILQSLDQMNKLVTYYEMREATTLFELALWKAKIDREEGSTINREAHRIEVPGPVKDTILQYLK